MWWEGCCITHGHLAFPLSPLVLPERPWLPSSLLFPVVSSLAHIPSCVEQSCKIRSTLIYYLPKYILCITIYLCCCKCTIVYCIIILFTVNKFNVCILLCTGYSFSLKFFLLLSILPSFILSLSQHCIQHIYILKLPNSQSNYNTSLHLSFVKKYTSKKLFPEVSVIDYSLIILAVEIFVPLMCTLVCPRPDSLSTCPVLDGQVGAVVPVFQRQVC